MAKEHTMSTGGLGSGGFFGGGGSGDDPFGGGGFSNFGPRGSFGVWPTCGCSSLLIILAGILLVCGGLMRLMGN
jgi:hypothetical protein